MKKHVQINPFNPVFQWLALQAGLRYAGHAKVLPDDDSPPTWIPSRFSQPDFSVGEQWLVARFPTAWARYRLLGDEFFDPTPEERKEALL